MPRICLFCIALAIAVEGIGADSDQSSAAQVNISDYKLWRCLTDYDLEATSKPSLRWMLECHSFAENEVHVTREPVCILPRLSLDSAQHWATVTAFEATPRAELDPLLKRAFDDSLSNREVRGVLGVSPDRSSVAVYGWCTDSGEDCPYSAVYKIINKDHPQKAFIVIESCVANPPTDFAWSPERDGTLAYILRRDRLGRTEVVRILKSGVSEQLHFRDVIAVSTSPDGTKLLLCDGNPREAINIRLFQSITKGPIWSKTLFVGTNVPFGGVSVIWSGDSRILCICREAQPAIRATLEFFETQGGKHLGEFRPAFSMLNEGAIVLDTIKSRQSAFALLSLEACSSR